MNSEQKTFSTKSLTMPAVATLMLSAGAILSTPAIATLNDTYVPHCQQILGGNDCYTAYIQIGSVTSSSGEVEIVKNKSHSKTDQPWAEFEIDTALDVIQKLSFLEVDDEMDRKIDEYFDSKSVKSKKIFIAKHNR